MKQTITVTIAVYMLHASDYRSYAIGIMAKDKNNEREPTKKKKQCAEFTTRAGTSILVFTSLVIHRNP